MLDKVLDNIKEIIGIEEYDNTKADADERLPDDITSKKFLILITCDIILASEKELSDNEFQRLKNTLAHMKNMTLTITCI